MKRFIIVLFLALSSMVNSLTTFAQTNPDFVWYQTGKLGIGFDYGYGLISDEPWQMGASIGVNTKLIKDLYLGARLGYSGVFVIDSGIDSSSHFLTIPVELGYALTFGEGGFALIPYAGLTPNIGLAGKTKIEDYGEWKQEIGGKFALETDLGIRIRLGMYTISATAVIPVNDICESLFGSDTYFRLSLGVGF
ncbi:MAG: hypothetical protein E7124_07000 [Bacteroidales bacterium]|nr:hypothetical protein [Bacteroidales bacterium]